MKAFVNWALGRRYRLILLAVAFAQISPVVASALFVVDAVESGLQRSATAALLSLLGIAVLALAAGSSLSAVLLAAAFSFFAGVGMGAALGWSRSLSFGYQATILGAVAGVLLMTFAGPEPATLIGPLLVELAEAMERMGATGPQLQALRDMDPAVFMPLVYGLQLVRLLSALLLGFWWYALVQGDGRFGVGFRALRLGRLVGIPLLLIISVSLVTDAAAVQNLTFVAVIAFMFQGLAVIHAFGRAKKWHPVSLGLVYVGFVPPLIAFTVLGLSAVGLLDNIFALRARLDEPA